MAVTSRVALLSQAQEQLGRIEGELNQAVTLLNRRIAGLERAWGLLTPDQQKQQCQRYSVNREQLVQELATAQASLQGIFPVKEIARKFGDSPGILARLQKTLQTFAQENDIPLAGVSLNPVGGQIKAATDLFKKYAQGAVSGYITGGLLGCALTAEYPNWPILATASTCAAIGAVWSQTFYNNLHRGAAYLAGGLLGGASYLSSQTIATQVPSVVTSFVRETAIPACSRGMLHAAQTAKETTLNAAASQGIINHSTASTISNTSTLTTVAATAALATGATLLYSYRSSLKHCWHLAKNFPNSVLTAGKEAATNVISATADICRGKTAKAVTLGLISGSLVKSSQAFDEEHFIHGVAWGTTAAMLARVAKWQWFSGSAPATEKQPPVVQPVIILPPPGGNDPRGTAVVEDVPDDIDGAVGAPRINQKGRQKQRRQRQTTLAELAGVVPQNRAQRRYRGPTIDILD